MSIAINREKCVGCGKCHEACPGTLIGLDADKKAYIKYPKDCWGCTSCLKECPVHAISFFLGADMGGQGSLLHIEKKNGLLHWIAEHPNGSCSEIVTDPKESNKY